jgi:transposase
MTDARWLHIMPHLPPQKPATGRPALDHRRMVEGMLWVMRSGTAWRFLPPQFGPWQTIYSRYQRWCKDGIWQRIVAVLHTADSLPSKVGAT